MLYELICFFVNSTMQGGATAADAGTARPRSSRARLLPYSARPAFATASGSAAAAAAPVEVDLSPLQALLEDRQSARVRRPPSPRAPALRPRGVAGGRSGGPPSLPSRPTAVDAAADNLAAALAAALSSGAGASASASASAAVEAKVGDAEWWRAVHSASRALALAAGAPQLGPLLSLARDITASNTPTSTDNNNANTNNNNVGGVAGSSGVNTVALALLTAFDDVSLELAGARLGLRSELGGGGHSALPADVARLAARAWRSAGAVNITLLDGGLGSKCLAGQAASEAAATAAAGLGPVAAAHQLWPRFAANSNASLRGAEEGDRARFKAFLAWANANANGNVKKSKNAKNDSPQSSVTYLWAAYHKLAAAAATATAAAARPASVILPSDLLPGPLAGADTVAAKGAANTNGASAHATGNAKTTSTGSSPSSSSSSSSSSSPLSLPPEASLWATRGSARSLLLDNPRMVRRAVLDPVAGTVALLLRPVGAVRPARRDAGGAAGRTASEAVVQTSTTPVERGAPRPGREDWGDADRAWDVLTVTVEGVLPRMATPLAKWLHEHSPDAAAATSVNAKSNVDSKIQTAMGNNNNNVNNRNAKTGSPAVNATGAGDHVAALWPYLPLGARSLGRRFRAQVTLRRPRMPRPFSCADQVLGKDWGPAESAANEVLYTYAALGARALTGVVATDGAATGSAATVLRGAAVPGLAEDLLGATWGAVAATSGHRVATEGKPRASRAARAVHSGNNTMSVLRDDSGAATGGTGSGRAPAVSAAHSDLSSGSDSSAGVLDELDYEGQYPESIAFHALQTCAAREVALFLARRRRAHAPRAAALAAAPLPAYTDAIGASPRAAAAAAALALELRRPNVAVIAPSLLSRQARARALEAKTLVTLFAPAVAAAGAATGADITNAGETQSSSAASATAEQAATAAFGVPRAASSLDQSQREAAAALLAAPLVPLARPPRADGAPAPLLSYYSGRDSADDDEEGEDESGAAPRARHNTPGARLARSLSQSQAQHQTTPSGSGSRARSVALAREGDRGSASAASTGRLPVLSAHVLPRPGSAAPWAQSPRAAHPPTWPHPPGPGPCAGCAARPW